MMTDEELEDAREFEHCHEYDQCDADGIIENLLDHINDQATQIATMKTICIKERCMRAAEVEAWATAQLAQEYPTIFGEDRK